MSLILFFKIIDGKVTHFFSFNHLSARLATIFSFDYNYKNIINPPKKKYTAYDIHFKGISKRSYL